MNDQSREIKESPIWQGVDEQIAYTLTTTPWGSTPTSPTVVIKDSTGADVSGTVMPSGSPSVAGDVITTPIVKSLTAGARYTMEIKFTISSNVFECFAVLIGQT